MWRSDDDGIDDGMMTRLKAIHFCVFLIFQMCPPIYLVGEEKRKHSTFSNGNMHNEKLL